MLDDVPSTAERAVETGTRGSGGDQTLVIDEGAEGIVFAELERLHREGLQVPRRVRGARRGRLRRRRRPGGDRPDRRLAQCQAQAAALRAVDRGRRRPDDGRRPVRLRLRLRRRRGVVGAGRRGGVSRRQAARSLARRAARPRRSPGAARRSSRPIPRWLAGPIAELASARTGCGPSARWRRRSARSRRRASTRCCRCATAVRSTSPPRS